MPGSDVRWLTQGRVNQDPFAKKSMMEKVAAYEKLAAYARSLERSNPPVDLQRPNRAAGDGDAGSE